MSFHVIIPARWASSRYPGKVLVNLGGRSILARVHDIAVASGAAVVVVAAGDDRVAEHARAQGFDVESTDPELRTGTDRVAQVVARRGLGDDVVVNLQADSPLMDPRTLALVAQEVRVGDARVVTASVPLRPGEANDPHVVKVVARPLGFDRRPLPNARRHLGIYGARAGTLIEWAAAPSSPDELRLSLEQLRAVWLGMSMRVLAVPGTDGPDIDVPADLAAAAEWLETHGARTHSKQGARAATVRRAAPGRSE